MLFEMVVPDVRERFYTQLFTRTERDTPVLADAYPEITLCLANVEGVAAITCVFIYKARRAHLRKRILVTENGSQILNLSKHRTDIHLRVIPLHQVPKIFRKFLASQTQIVSGKQNYTFRNVKFQNLI